MEKVSGFAKSLAEVLITVSFTFLPFVILAIRWPADEGGNTQHAISAEFLGYWQSGELVLPILGLCGSVTALLALNTGYFYWWVHAAVGVIVLILALGGGAALAESDGFNAALNAELVVAGFVLYLCLAVVWLLLAAVVRSTEPTPRASDKRALMILEQARMRRQHPETSP